MLLFQSLTKRWRATQFSIQIVLNSLQNSTCSLIFRTLLVYRTTPTISTKNPFLHFIQLSPDYYLLTYLQYYPCNPYQHFFCQYQKQFTPKEISLPQPLNQYRLCQGNGELGSLVRTDTVLVSSSFLEVWAGKTGHTVTGSLSLRLKRSL